MTTDGLVSKISPADRVEGAPTPGMRREEAFAIDGMWAGLVTTDPHMISGWHHHGEYDTSIYVLDGAVRMECGPGGSTVVEAVPGDFMHVPKGVIHRESNPTDGKGRAIVIRAGSGAPVFNVDGPAIA